MFQSFLIITAPAPWNQCVSGHPAVAGSIGATFPQRKIQIDAEKVVRKILTIKGLHNYNEQDLLTAVEFIEANHTSFPFEKLIYDGFSLSNASDAFQHAIEKNNFRVGIQTTINP